ncbi:TSUP family transporter [Campylobacter sp. 19-13652]|uniref:TSUP family transporter n=1 Tax=Campylobacter sp. 19-13652 TaxID=2840180 RepID=UPI001C767A20|nr:TSUP family transporter [Campylobacter sp. 19-13652]BCX79680.1 UPF0721 transmembrane protein [Campylobacter sp. 19-13652]
MELDLFSYFIFILSAFTAGFIDAIAGGGGLITVPTLLAMGMPPHLALGTNKLQASLGCLAAAIKFGLSGLINFKEIISGILFTFMGSFVGTRVILHLDAGFLRYIIPVMLVAIFIYTIFSHKVGESDKKAKLKPAIFWVIFGFSIGFYDGFFGPGTGSFWTFSLVAILGLNLKKAVANTKALNLTSNIVSFATFAISSNVLWKVGFLMGTAAIIGAFLGASLAIKREIKFIRGVFLFVVGITILKLIFDIIFK